MRNQKKEREENLGAPGSNSLCTADSSLYLLEMFSSKNMYLPVLLESLQAVYGLPNRTSLCHTETYS